MGTVDEAAVAKGELLLALLTSQAEWARAEAQRVELELLLVEARDGDSSRLRQWLQERPGLHGQVASRETSLRGTEHASDPPRAETANEDAIASWDTLLPFARQRLAARLQKSPASREVPRDGPAEGQRPAVPLARGRPTGPKRRGLNPAGPKQSGPKSSAGARPVDAGLPADAARKKRRKILLLSDRRGWAASLLAHLVLLAVLAVITLKLPSPPSSLAIESRPVELVPEALEVMAPVESQQPETQETTQFSEALELPAELLDKRPAVALPTDVAVDNLSIPSNSPPSAAALATVSGALAAMQASASFFGAAANGNCFCYVIDGSGSMRGGPWEAAKLELLNSLASLQASQRFYIIFFNRQLSPIPGPGTNEPAPRALYASPENLEHARRWIETLEIAIGAPPNAALELAIAKEPDAIYLLTDGVTTADVAGFLRQQNRVSDLIAGEKVRVPIHTIAFYSLEGQELLQRIARENRGQFIYVPDPRKR